MIVAGFGGRAGARVASYHDALARTNAGGITHLATIAPRADALRPLAQALGLPLIVLDPVQIAGLDTQTASAHSIAAMGVGSVAEACALAAIGSGAQLRGVRVVSGDGQATCAIAERGRG